MGCMLFNDSQKYSRCYRMKTMLKYKLAYNFTICNIVKSGGE